MVESEGVMALFTAASKHFVKTAGNASLHSVPDLNSAERCKTLCLVYRKTSFWPWKKAKIKPTLVTLNDILEKQIDTAPFVTTEVLAEGYKDTPSFNADGSIGTKIATELDLDLSTTNKFSLKVDFGDISKTDVKWESLERALAISKVNLDHEIFQELKQKKRTSLCIVLESLACKKDGTLDETSDIKGTGSVSGTAPKVSTVSVDVHAKGDVESTTHFAYTIPSNTVIAFSCTKFDVSDQGILSMHVGVDRVDNIEANVALNVDRSAQIKAELAPLMSAKKFPEIKSALLDILKTPQCVEEFLELVSTAYCMIEEKTNFALPAKDISEKFSNVKGWKTFLELIGFSIPETLEGSKIEFPRKDPEKIIHGCWALLEALSDLPDNDINLLLQCKKENKESLLHAISNTMLGKNTTNADIGKLLDTESNEKELLTSLGLVVVDGENGKYLEEKWHSSHKIIDAYAAVFSLL